MNKLTDADKLQLLWSRAGFGLPLDALRSPKSLDETIAAMLQPPMPLPIEVLTQEEWQEANPKAIKASGLSGEAQKMKIRSYRERSGELGLLWMRQMAATEHPLQEKIALFWHGHFATRADNPYFDQILLQQFRAGGLGSFGDLLKAVSMSPGMLKFLNNQQNKKQHPNENFARELMELFTLGRGNYSETDVKEAARAFTGWGFDEDGEFLFREGQHDNGKKTFLGKTGAFTGGDILDIILEQKQTAFFITQKLCRYFINEESVADAGLRALAKIFYDSGYNITTLLRAIFSSGYFYQPSSRGAHIKSPVELLTGMQRVVPVEFEQERTLIMLQRVLGQQLFYPPNVAGWTGGKAWIDASSLAIRMRLPEAIYAFKELELRAKEIDAEMADISKKPVAPESGSAGKFRVGKADADWTVFTNYWQRFEEARLPRLLADFLIAVPVSDAQLETAVRFSSKINKEAFIKTLTILLMTLPEYQLC